MIDAELLTRYDVPTPRYTSYPTALSFRSLGRLAPPTATEMKRPVALYFHVPFCRELCWYCACTKVVTRRSERSGPLVDRLLAELRARRRWLGERPVVQLHLGGGTPTFLAPHDLERLIAGTRELARIADDAELSIEIDPRTFDEGRRAALSAAGFNRVSLGVQDHDPAVQRAIHRVQSLETTRACVDAARGTGIESVNFDLVYGLPEQTPASFRRTVEDIVALGPDRLAVYSYAHVPNVAPAQRIFEKRNRLPVAAEKIEMFLGAVEILEAAGYEHIGMDHFALPTDSLAVARRDGTLRRNFMGYTTHDGVDIHAFGMSAISQTSDTYIQNVRVQARWEELIDAGMPTFERGVIASEEDRIRRDVIMAIMCSNGLDLEELGARHGRDLVAMFADEWAGLEGLVADGLVEVEGPRLEVTPRGRFLVRNVAAVFDHRRGVKGYSRAV